MGAEGDRCCHFCDVAMVFDLPWSDHWLMGRRGPNALRTTCPLSGESSLYEQILWIG